MPTNRTPLRRNLRRSISPAAVEAWKKADYVALHRALGLAPWEASPLPSTIDLLGVSEKLVASADPNSDRSFEQSYAQAIELQRLLFAMAGPPDCREAYERNLVEAENRLAYCEECIEQPEHAHNGTGCDPESQRAELERALDQVAFRTRLLDELGQ